MQKPFCGNFCGHYRTESHQLRTNFHGWSALRSLRLPHSLQTDTAAACLAGFDLPELRSLHIEHTLIPLEIVVALTQASLPKLQELSLPKSQLEVAALTQLARGSWPCLETLDISRLPEALGSLIDHNCTHDPLAGSNWPSLRVLNAAGWGSVHLFTTSGKVKWPELMTLSASGLRMTAPSGSVHPSLSKICIHDACQPECLTDVLGMQLPALACLEVMFYGYSYTTSMPAQCHYDFGTIVSHGAWPCLATMNLFGHSVGLSRLAPVMQADWRHMESLNLSENCLTAEAVGHLAACEWPALCSLALDCNSLDYHAIMRLVCGNWPELSHLSLVGNKFDQTALVYLVKGAWPHLETLDLSDNWIDRAGLRTLTQGNWPDLSELVLKGDKRINVDCVFEVYLKPGCIQKCVFADLLQIWSDVYKAAVAKGRLEEVSVSLYGQDLVALLSCLGKDGSEPVIAAADLD